MKYEGMFKNHKGEILKTFQGESVDIDNVLKDFRLPRTFTIRYGEGNEEFYGKLLHQVGKTLRMESDKINGIFNISLNVDGKIKLKEVTI